MTGQILTFYSDVDGAVNELTNAITSAYELLGPPDILESDVQLEQYLDKLEQALVLIKPPDWLEKATNAEEKLLYDLECRADAISY